MDTAKELQKIEIGNVCLLAGKIMLECGAETYRVEDTMIRIAHSLGAKSADSYVTPTAIIFTIEEEDQAKTKMLRIMKGGTDLNKVTAINSLSREVSAGKYTAEQAYAKLRDIEEKKITYPVVIQIFAAAMTSAGFLIMFQGVWQDFLPAFFVGATGYFTFLMLERLTDLRFFTEFTSSIVISLLAILFVQFGIGDEADKIIIGSVMPLVPGLLITNAIRDLMARHLVSGLAKGAEAILTAFAIGSGVAVVLFFI